MLNLSESKFQNKLFLEAFYHPTRLINVTSQKNRRFLSFRYLGLAVRLSLPPPSTTRKTGSPAYPTGVSNGQALLHKARSQKTSLKFLHSEFTDPKICGQLLSLSYRFASLRAGG